MTSDLTSVGLSTPRRDSAEKAGGTAKYADDFSLPNQLYGAVAKSTVAILRER